VKVISQPRRYPTDKHEGTIIVKENPPSSNTPHDLLMKELLRQLYEPFIKAFYPKLYELIDFQSAKLLSEEMILNAFKGEKRLADIVIEAKLKFSGQKIILHIEPQSYVQQNFNERMFIYYSQLFAKLNAPIVPIAIYTYDSPQNINHLQHRVGGYQFLNFNYLTLHLRSKYWRDFIQQENLISATLICLMKYNPDEKVEMKVEFYRIVQRAKPDVETERYLYQFFDTYLILSKEEEDKVMEIIKRDRENFDFSSLPIAIEERAKEIGREKGRIEGREEGRKEGRKEGRAIEQEKVAINMLKDNLPIEKIMQYVDLSEERIKQLMEKL